MDFQPNLEQTLRSLQAGHLSVEDALEQINGVKELGYAAIDTDRQRRNGFPEVVYGEGKTVEQIQGILQLLSQKELPILTTRVSLQKGEALSQRFPTGHYYPEARCFILNSKKEEVDSEVQMFQNALEFSGVKAREIMIPRTKVFLIDKNRKSVVFGRFPKITS